MCALVVVADGQTSTFSGVELSCERTISRRLSVFDTYKPPLSHPGASGESAFLSAVPERSGWVSIRLASPLLCLEGRRCSASVPTDVFMQLLADRSPRS